MSSPESRAGTSCAELSIAAGEQLAGTATQGRRWLLVEADGPWGRDAVADTRLPEAARAALLAFDGKVILIRRPRHRVGCTVVSAVVTEDGGEARALRLPSLDALPETDLGSGAILPKPLVLVCVHGRRDACCARLGTSLYAAVAAVADGGVWQCSHLGGHRLAPNALVLPYGVQLGRVPVARAPVVVSLLRAGRIPLDLYRGCTLYPPHVQAAEIAVRTAAGADRVGDLRLLADEGGRVVFATPHGERGVRVSQSPGPPAPPSCGAEPASTAVWTASLEPV